MCNKANSNLLQFLIHKATEESYKNAYEWQTSDGDIASQLRDGIKTAVSYFSKIDNDINAPNIILNLMQEHLNKALKYYRQLPGDYGQWECSALNIINKNVKKMVEHKYAPSPEEISNYKAQLKSLI